MLDEVSSALSGDAAAKLQAATTQIYEACSFQDITGQRITKIVATLKAIEGKVAHIIGTFGPSSDARAARGPHIASDADLLNGPQLPTACHGSIRHRQTAGEFLNDAFLDTASGCRRRYPGRAWQRQRMPPVRKHRPAITVRSGNHPALGAWLSRRTASPIINLTRTATMSLFVLVTALILGHPAAVAPERALDQNRWPGVELTLKHGALLQPTTIGGRVVLDTMDRPGRRRPLQPRTRINVSACKAGPGFSNRQPLPRPQLAASPEPARRPTAHRRRHQPPASCP